MVYLTRTYYAGAFGGTLIPEEDFPVLARIASEVVDALVTTPIPEPVPELVCRAAAYEADMIYSHGAEDAAAGITVALGGFNEKVGDCSIGNNRLSTAGSRIPSIGGIPVSALTLSLLSRGGFRCRAVSAAGGTRG